MALKVASIGRPNPQVSIFKDAGIEVVEAEPSTTEEVIDILKDVDGALIGIWPLTDRQVLEASPKLKVVSRSVFRGPDKPSRPDQRLCPPTGDPIIRRRSAGR